MEKIFFGVQRLEFPDGGVFFMPTVDGEPAASVGLHELFPAFKTARLAAWAKNQQRIASGLPAAEVLEECFAEQNLEFGGTKHFRIVDSYLAALSKGKHKHGAQ